MPKSIRSACALFILTFLIETSRADIVSLSALRARDQEFDSSCQDIDPKLPTDFKCSSSSTCVSLDNSSSALCCPQQQTCNQIKPIDCETQLQNATTYPNALIFTSKLNQALPKCGASTCCPFGYNCLQSGGTSFCQLNAETSHSGVINSTSSATVSLAMPTATSTSTPTATIAGINSNQHLPPSKCNKFPGGVFMAGFFPGILIGALGVVAWMILTGRHQKEDDSDRDSVQAMKPPLVISAPLPHPNSGSRADFLRRGLTRTKSVFSIKSAKNGVDSNPWNTRDPAPPMPTNGAQRGFPVTPENQVGRPPSAESIKIFSPMNILEHPGAAVAPLRTMQTQRAPPDPAFGSPFKTPPKPQHDDYNYNDPSYDMETLAPQRYNGPVNKGKQREVEPEHDSNRDTSFTTMLEHCRIPDRGDEFPVPKLPKQYQGRMPYETRI